MATSSGRRSGVRRRRPCRRSRRLVPPARCARRRGRTAAAMVRALRLLYGRSQSVAIEAVAVGREPGRARMLINVDNPTVSSISPAFVEAAHGAPGWETQRWSETADVAVTTLDALIAKHGVPAFIKLDVEGFEAEALSGPVAGGARAVVRVHDHPARRRACLHRAVLGAGLHALQRGAWRKPDADRGLDECAAISPVG